MTLTKRRYRYGTDAKALEMQACGTAENNPK
jgi:hypothetical protein